MKDNKCQNIIDELIENNQGTGLSKVEINDLFQDYPECSESISDFLKTWTYLGELESPEPSAKMDDLFYENLEKFKHNQVPAEGFSSKLISFYKKNQKTLFTLGIAASIFLAGMLVGPFFQSDSNHPNLVDNGSEEQGMYQLTGYQEDQLSINRLEDVNKIKELPQLNRVIIEALNQALLKDPNINVRLSAIEAMLHFADHPKVRQNLIEAIPYQTSPIVQLTLAEVMIELQETKSKEAWNKLLKEGHVEEDIKKHLEETLDIII